jgi:ABC-type phosphate transport system substrate-binding protein
MLKRAILCCVLLCVTHGISLCADVVIVSHVDAPIESLSKDKLRKIFLGRLKSVRGRKVIPILNSDETKYASFLDKYIQMSSAQFKRHWAKMMYTGKAMKPKLYDKGTIISKISDNKYSLSYLNKDDALELSSSIKILEVH